MSDEENNLLAVLDRRATAYRRYKDAEKELDDAEEAYDRLMKERYGEDWRRVTNTRARLQKDSR